MKNTKEQIAEVNKLLIERFGVPPRPENPPDPVDLLIATILSQNTNDRNSYKAFNNLKNAFADWEEAAKLPASKIENYIKIAGLGKQKSRAIKNFLSTIKKEKGEISLEYTRDFSNDEIISDLTDYPGIGLKTASCVLLFSLRRNVCPVDTHVNRTVNRIGIVNCKTPDKTFIALNRNMPEKAAHSFHTNLIRLGREICKPAKPNCAICPLLKICTYDDKNMEPQSGYKKNSFMLLDSIEG